MSDPRFTHIALPVGDVSRAVEWYERYTPLREIENLHDADGVVAWLCHPQPAEHPFVLVLAATGDPDDMHPGELGPNGHLGIELPTHDAVDAMAVLGRADGCLVREPGHSFAGYTCALADPDGNVVQFGCDQAVATLARAALTAREPTAPTESTS